MLAITGKDRISLITDLKLYQINGRYVIRYNNDGYYNSYETKDEAMTDFILLSNELKKSGLKIVQDKLQELADISEKENENR